MLLLELLARKECSSKSWNEERFENLQLEEEVRLVEEVALLLSTVCVPFSVANVSLGGSPMSIYLKRKTIRGEQVQLILPNSNF